MTDSVSSAHRSFLPSPLHEHRLNVLFWILTAAAAGMAALLALLPAAGHDQLWFLLMARRWLAGAPLYGPQAFDANFPAVVWFSALPVTLANLLHGPATLPAKVLVCGLASVSALLSFRLLPLVWRPLRRYEAVALLFAAVVLFGVVPARDFGQRDHLAALLLLPYILAAAIPVPSGPLLPYRLAAGALAAGAICLKPHYALVPVLIETALLLTVSSGPETDRSAPALNRRHRLLRPEPFVLLAVGAFYLLAIRRFAPLYFTEALPISREVYWAIGYLRWPQLLWEAVELCLLAALSGWLFFRRRHAAFPAVRLLLLAGAAGFAAYLLQGTGWYYQQLPAITFFGFALALQLLDLAAGRAVSVPAWLPRAAAALALLALALTIHFTGYPFTPDRAFAIDSPDPAIFAALPRGTPVAILTTSVDEAMMPVERYGLTWAQRTNNLWLLPAILHSEQPEGSPPLRRLTPQVLAGLEALQHRWIAEDLARWQPQLILVERCQDAPVRCQVLEDRHDDLLAWFLRDAAFASLWQHYTLARADGRFDVYRHR